MLRRTDLTCELVGSLAFGWLYTTAGVMVSVAAATMLAVVFLPMQLYCIFWVRCCPCNSKCSVDILVENPS